jgi:hypothetical protein
MGAVTATAPGPIATGASQSGHASVPEASRSPDRIDRRFSSKVMRISLI